MTVILSCLWLFPVICVSLMYNGLIFTCVTGRALALPRSFVCKGDDKKLRLFNRVPLTALSFIFQGCETKSTSSPRLWEHPRYCVIVAVGDLGSSLSAQIFPDSPSWTKTHRILLAKANRAGRCRCHTEIVFFLYVKSKAHLALNGSLNRYQVFSFAGIKKYVDIGKQMVNWILTLGCTYLGIWALPGWW